MSRWMYVIVAALTWTIQNLHRERFILCILLAFTPAFAIAQQEVRKYYDPEKTAIQEIYFVSGDNPDELTGRYQRFYENGNLMVEGHFEDGKKSGLFTEYHENGTLARKINYVKGVRHG